MDLDMITLGSRSKSSDFEGINLNPIARVEGVMQKKLFYIIITLESQVSAAKISFPTGYRQTTVNSDTERDKTEVHLSQGILLTRRRLYILLQVGLILLILKVKTPPDQ